MANPLKRLSQAVASRYEIERELGRGGMAIVYLARDLRHDRQVALKVLLPELASVVGSERFAREIKITAQLEHPHILHLLDSGEADGLPYFVMTYAEGETLSERLEREQQLPVEDAVRIASEVADALVYAHSLGVIHRDIKPSNIMLVGEHVLVADFGIAKAVNVAGGEKLTQTGLAIGTPAYMSPEQATGSEKVDGRSDLYSLGCVLYEMLVGEPPFTGPTPQAILARHSLDPAPSLRTVRATVPETLERVVAKAMAKVPADRYATAGQFRDALTHLDTARVGRPWSRMTKSVRLAGIAAVVAIAAAVLLGRFVISQPNNLDPNRIMVYPLVMAGQFQGNPTIGEDVATMIGHALDGTGPLRWIDGWTQLGEAQRSDIRTLSPDAARTTAVRERCGLYLTGRVVARGDSADVFLDLRDVQADSLVSRASVSGLASEAWRLGVQAVNGLLPTLIPAGTPSLAAGWEDRNPAAVANFLLGESNFRRARLDEALSFYRDAVASDSLFSMAAVRGAQAATWNHRPDQAARLIEVALANERTLAPRQRHFARGVDAYVRGLADSAVRELRRALDLDREMSVAWMQLGEVYTHLLPRAHRPDSLAADAFAEANRLDPSAVNVLFHLLEIALREGDLDRARPMREKFLAAGPDSNIVRDAEMMFACVSEGVEEVNWSRAGSEYPSLALYVAKSLGAGGAQPDCAKAGYRAILSHDTARGDVGDGRRWSAVIGLQSLLLAQGRTAEATALLDSVIASGFGGTSLYLLDGAAGADVRERARAVAAHDREVYGETYSRLPFIRRLWLLGLWEASEGHTATVEAIARDLEGRSSASGDRLTRLLADAMGAHLALSRGDTAGAIARLERLAPNAPHGAGIPWSEVEPLGPERMLLAELLFSRGRFQEALEVASLFDSPLPLVYPLYLAASLELRAAAAQALGDPRAAANLRARLETLRSGS